MRYQENSLIAKLCPEFFREMHLASNEGASPAEILVKSLSVAGIGWKRKDILDGDNRTLALLEEHLLESGGTYEDALFFAGGIGATPPEKTEPLFTEESETRIGRSALSLFLSSPEAKERKNRDANNPATVFVREVLSNSLNISEALGISEPSAGCIRLVAGATALGAFGSEHEVPCCFWADIADDWRRTFESATSRKKFSESFFPAVVLGNMLSTGALHGFGDLPEHCETGFDFSAKECSETIFRDTTSLLARIFSGVPEEEIASYPGGAGLKKLVVLSGNARLTPEFWIPEKAFEIYGEAEVSKNAPTPLRALAASFLAFEDEETAHLGESLETVSLFLSGRFDVVRFDRSGDLFSVSASDRDVPSVCETKGFGKRLGELGKSSPFGKQVFQAFVAECLSALSVPDDFADRDPEKHEAGELPPFASDRICRYLGKHISELFLASDNPFGCFARFVALPCVPTLAAYRDSSGAPLVLRISEIACSGDRTHRRAFADGVAATRLMSDDGLVGALAETAARGNECREAERVADFLLVAFDGLTSLDLDDENGLNHTIPSDAGLKQRKIVLENALAEYVSGVRRFLLETEKLSFSVASDIRKKVVKKLSEYRAVFSSLEERSAAMRNAYPDENADTTEIRIRSAHKRRTVEVPEIGGSEGGSEQSF